MVNPRRAYAGELWGSVSNAGRVVNRAHKFGSYPEGIGNRLSRGFKRDVARAW